MNKVKLVLLNGKLHAGQNKPIIPALLKVTDLVQIFWKATKMVN